MSLCEIGIEVVPLPRIEPVVGASAPIQVASAHSIPAFPNVDVRSIVAQSIADVHSKPTLDVGVGSRPLITPSVTDRPVIVAEAGDCLMSFLDSLELRAERARRDVIKLAAYTTAINVPNSTPVELPTGLVVYPSFRDSGLLEISVGAAHANMNGATLTLALMIGPAGSLTNVANFTTPAINPSSSAGNFQLEFMLRIRSRGPQALNYGGWFQWNDAGGAQQSPIVGRITTANFGNPANGDNGDVEVRLDAYLSTSGPTLNLSGYLIEQHSPKSLFYN